jgi:hypothetical protein
MAVYGMERDELIRHKEKQIATSSMPMPTRIVPNRVGITTMARTIQLLLLASFARCLTCTSAGFISRPSRCSRLVEATATTTTTTTKLTAFRFDWNKKDDADDDDDLGLSLGAFQQAKKKQKQQQNKAPESFDGYALRDVIFKKWGFNYDVNFNRVDSWRDRQLFLNIMPYRLGRKPFRHDTELDYLSHLQAVVEILRKYEQLDYVLEQISDTDKKPLGGRSPIVAVPIRLNLTKDQVDKIIG